MGNKSANIGMRQLFTICNMSYRKRIAFIGEGLPILIDSVQECYDSANLLLEKPRSREMLMGQSGEEATKIMILIDMLRCPEKRISRNVKKLTSWFYSHLVRMTYDEACSWRPDTIARLKEYVKPGLASHYLDGNLGEYIYPNWRLYLRESRLYGDVVIVDDRLPAWTSPLDENLYNYTRTPDSITLVQSLHAMGLLTLAGAKIIADVWSKIDFTDDKGYSDANSCIIETLNKAQSQGLIHKTATDDDVQNIHRYWQWPMYDFDLKIIERSLEDLQEEQAHLLAWEMS